MRHTFVVAIDGPAAAGKGTLARSLAGELDFGYLDSGRIYRAIGLKAATARIEPCDTAGLVAIAQGLHFRDLQDPATGSGQAGRLAARYSGERLVRELAVALQRRIVEEEPGERQGMIIDGRDIGTVVFPDAPAKLFVTASADVRARRRHAELVALGETAELEQVRQDLMRRDHMDMTREVDPLTQAADAVLLDTSEMDISTAVEAARRIVEAARSRWETSCSG